MTLTPPHISKKLPPLGGYNSGFKNNLDRPSVIKEIHYEMPTDNGVHPFNDPDQVL